MDIPSQSKQERFILRAYLRTPIIMQGYLTLDALLMAKLTCGDVSHLLHCQDDLYYASAAFPVDVIGTQYYSFVASMRPTTMGPVWAESLAPNSANKLSIGESRQREYGNVTNRYLATACKAVEWHATGDASAVHEILRDTAFLGKRRATGMGEVAQWEIEAGELDVIVSYLGEPLRPVPVGFWLHGGDWPVIEAAWRPEYWATRNRCCVRLRNPGERMYFCEYNKYAILQL
jgi:hypothetical protein